MDITMDWSEWTQCGFDEQRALQLSWQSGSMNGGEPIALDGALIVHAAANVLNDTMTGLLGPVTALQSQRFWQLRVPTPWIYDRSVFDAHPSMPGFAFFEGIQVECHVPYAHLPEALRLHAGEIRSNPHALEARLRDFIEVNVCMLRKKLSRPAASLDELYDVLTSTPLTIQS